MRDEPILISGAGIAGLALGIALAGLGIPARILEQRREAGEAGAGIQLGPNAMHVLTRLGVAARLEPLCGCPEAIEVADGPTGRLLASLPTGTFLADRHGAPYRVAHRADLHAALLSRAREMPGLDLVMGFEVASWSESTSAVQVRASDGTHATGALLVGADGVWSTVRRTLFPDHPLAYAGKMAARTLIPAPADGSRFARAATGVWLGHDAHVVHYPVRSGREIAVVVIVDEPIEHHPITRGRTSRPSDRIKMLYDKVSRATSDLRIASGDFVRPDVALAREGWGGPVERTDVLQRLARFAPDLLAFLARSQDWRAWSLYDPAPLPAWSRGRVCVIGDAAHPILPFLAQGGAMALEDADTLAALMAAGLDDLPAALAKFDILRRARVDRVQKASRSNGTVFHLSGIAGHARNLTLALVPSRLLMARYDWLYGWKADTRRVQ